MSDCWSSGKAHCVWYQELVTFHYLFLFVSTFLCFVCHWASDWNSGFFLLYLPGTCHPVDSIALWEKKHPPDIILYFFLPQYCKTSIFFSHIYNSFIGFYFCSYIQFSVLVDLLILSQIIWGSTWCCCFFLICKWGRDTATCLRSLLPTC